MARRQVIVGVELVDIAYYDQEVISSDEVRRLIKRLGANVIHVHRDDVDWPEDCHVRTETVWQPRDDRFRSILMGLLDGIRSELPAIQTHGLNLLEISRYSWLFACEEEVHRIWVIDTLLSRHAVRTFCWRGPVRPPLFVDKIQSGDTKTAFEFDTSAKPNPFSVVYRIWNSLRVYLWKTRENLRESAWKKARKAPYVDMNSSQTKLIVFAETFPNSAKLATQVAEKLRTDDSLLPVFVAGNHKTAQSIATKGFAVRLLQEFRKSAATRGSKDKLPAGERFSRALRELPDRLYCFSSRAASYRQCLLSCLGTTGREVIAQAAQYAEDATGMVEALRPVAIVSTTYSSSFGRATAMAAARRGVISILLQHGTFRENAQFYYNIQQEYALVWGALDKRMLAKAGWLPERVRVIGAPSQDYHVLKAKEAATSLAGRSRIHLLFLPSRTNGQVVSRAVAERTFRSIARTVLAQENLELVVKLHPADHTGVAERLIGGLPRITIAKEGNSLDYLAQCDIAIITASTTGLEACALGKPLIIYNMTGMPDIVDFESSGAALKATSESEFVEALKRVLTDSECLVSLKEGRSRLVAEFLDGSTGHSCQKAADTIREIVGANELSSTVEAL